MQSNGRTMRTNINLVDSTQDYHTISITETKQLGIFSTNDFLFHPWRHSPCIDPDSFHVANQTHIQGSPSHVAARKGRRKWAESPGLTSLLGEDIKRKIEVAMGNKKHQPSLSHNSRHHKLQKWLPMEVPRCQNAPSGSLLQKKTLTENKDTGKENLATDKIKNVEQEEADDDEEKIKEWKWV